jgi:hypothetical protein
MKIRLNLSQVIERTVTPEVTELEDTKTGIRLVIDEKRKQVAETIFDHKKFCEPNTIRTLKPDPETFISMCCLKNKFNPATQRCIRPFFVPFGITHPITKKAELIERFKTGRLQQKRVKIQGYLIL